MRVWLGEPRRRKPRRTRMPSRLRALGPGRGALQSRKSARPGSAARPRVRRSWRGGQRPSALRAPSSVGGLTDEQRRIACTTSWTNFPRVKPRRPCAISNGSWPPRIIPPWSGRSQTPEDEDQLSEQGKRAIRGKGSRISPRAASCRIRMSSVSCMGSETPPGPVVAPGLRPFHTEGCAGGSW